MLVTCKDGKIEVGWTKMRKELNYLRKDERKRRLLINIDLFGQVHKTALHLQSCSLT